MEEVVHGIKGVYTPGVKRWSLYRGLWMRYGNAFAFEYDALFAARFGRLKDDARDEIRKVIECGEFTNGFVSHTCGKCGTKIVIPFTCKSRLCLSCRHKSLFGWSMNFSYFLFRAKRPPLAIHGFGGTSASMHVESFIKKSTAPKPRRHLLFRCIFESWIFIRFMHFCDLNHPFPSRATFSVCSEYTFTLCRKL